MVIKVEEKVKPIRLVVLSLVLLFLISNTTTWGIVYPSPTTDFYVNDFASVLNAPTKAQIQTLAAELERKTTAQVVVVTLNDLEDQSLEEYSTALFREWGIGDGKKNNGVLILLDLGGRQSRIEVGYGLEGALPDGKTGRIQDVEMIPHYQRGDYNSGILAGFKAIIKEIYIEYGYEAPQQSPYRQQSPYGSTTDEEGIPPILIIIGIIIIFPLIILDFKYTGGAITYMIIRSASRGSRGSRSSGGGGISGGGGRSGGGGSSRRF